MHTQCGAPGLKGRPGEGKREKRKYWNKRGLSRDRGLGHKQYGHLFRWEKKKDAKDRFSSWPMSGQAVEGSVEYQAASSL